MSHISKNLEHLVAHLREHSVRTDGPFRLRSGEMSDWYIDARQTTFSGDGARVVGAAVLEAVPDGVQAVGGMTMGADPIAFATAIVAAEEGRPLSAFSIRKVAKDHGVGGRLVGPVGAGTRVVMLEDTTTTGGALIEAIGVARAEGLEIVRAVSLVDRSAGATGRRVADMGIDYLALVTPAMLGVEA
ncbi:MAG TPA: orotate phosphoribosyltransferase [Acidimicrobiia bacterium]